MMMTAAMMTTFCSLCFQEEENRLREELRQEWELKQEKIKSRWLTSHRHTNIYIYLDLQCVIYLADKFGNRFPSVWPLGSKSYDTAGLDPLQLVVFFSCTSEEALDSPVLPSVCLCVSPGEEIEITFSYWDGSGHRKTVKVQDTATYWRLRKSAALPAPFINPSTYQTSPLCLCVDEEGQHHPELPAESPGGAQERLQRAQVITRQENVPLCILVATLLPSAGFLATLHCSPSPSFF